MEFSSISFTNNPFEQEDYVEQTSQKQPSTHLQRSSGHSSLLPVVVSAVRKSKCDEFGQLVLFQTITNAIVCIVGNVMKSEAKGNCLILTIHDGTGVIIGRQWLINSADMRSFYINRTVKVIGVAKRYQDELCITIQHIEVVSSFNTVICHLMNTIVSTTLHTRKCEKSSEVIVNRQPIRATVSNTIESAFMSKRSAKPKQTPPLQSLTHPESTLDALLQEDVWEEEALTQQQRSVLQIIQRNGVSSTEGVSMQTILHNGHNLGMSPKDIVATVYQLLSQGHAYNTIDSSHFKPTNLYFYVCLKRFVALVGHSFLQSMDHIRRLKQCLTELGDGVEVIDIVRNFKLIFDALDKIGEEKSDINELLSFWDLCISQQPTKGPIYSILFSLMTSEHRSFVADCVTVIHHSLLSSIRDGEAIPSILKMRFLVLLSIFDVVDTESLSQSFFSLLDMIKLTHSAILIRVFASTMLYTYPFTLAHGKPLSIDNYVDLANSFHSYMETDYRKSSTFIGQSRGFLKHTTTANDFFIQCDSALQMIASALRKSQKTPAAANCLRTLDLNYSSLVRSAYEALQKSSEDDLEEGEEVSINLKDTQDVQETLIALYRGKRLRISTLIEWPTDISTIGAPHFICQLLDSNAEISYAVLPLYQSLLIYETVENILLLFCPSWEYASRFIRGIHLLVCPYHEIDQRTLDKNITSTTVQVLFSYILDTTQPSNYRLQAENVLLQIAVWSINSADHIKESLFIQRFSPAIFRYVDTICMYGDKLTAEALQVFVTWFAKHMTNTEYFWPWQKWERVSQYPVTSAYHIIISEFMIACSSQDPDNVLVRSIPEVILRLRLIGRFNPTQPIRDQNAEYVEHIRHLLQEKNLQSNFEKLLADQYNGHGYFGRELGIVLQTCLQEKGISKICDSFRRYSGILKLLVVDRQLMVIEEVFADAYRNYAATAFMMRELVSLEVISVYDYLHFLRIENTNHSIFYYWTILDMLLLDTNSTESYVDVFETLLDLHNKISCTTNAVFVVSFIEQMMKHYKIKFTKRADYVEFVPQVKERLLAMKLQQARSNDMARYLTQIQ